MARRTLLLTVTALAVWAGAALAGAPPAAGADGATLTSPTAPVTAGDNVSVTGTGFTSPGCELTYLGQEIPCAPESPLGSFVVSFGEFSDEPVRACTPNCTNPWADDSANLALTSPEIFARGGPSLATPPSAGSLVLSPNPASQGGTVTVTDDPLAAAAQSCQLAWDGALQRAAMCQVQSGGSLTAGLVVPADASSGSHQLQACQPTCANPAGGQAQLTVTVLPVVRTGSTTSASASATNQGVVGTGGTATPPAAGIAPSEAQGGKLWPRVLAGVLIALVLALLVGTAMTRLRRPHADQRRPQLRPVPDATPTVRVPDPPRGAGPELVVRTVRSPATVQTREGSP